MRNLRAPTTVAPAVGCTRASPKSGLRAGLVAIEKINPRNLHGFNDGVDFGPVPAFRKIGNTFNQRIGHRDEDNHLHCRAATANPLSPRTLTADSTVDPTSRMGLRAKARRIPA